MYSVATDQDIQDMARGAVFLGSGGGGDPYVGELYLRRQLAEGRQARIVKAAELPDDAFVISIGRRRRTDRAGRTPGQHQHAAAAAGKQASSSMAAKSMRSSARRSAARTRCSRSRSAREPASR
jgi:hypothetical protein